MSVAITAALADFDSGFSTETPGGDRRPGVESLADGDYDFEIRSATLELLADKPVLRLGLQVAEGGGGVRMLDHLFWIDSQVKANIVGAFLVGLGIPADQWRQFSQELPRVVGTLRGMRFVGTKKTNTSKDGTKDFHNLYVKSVIGGGRGMRNTQRPAPQQPSQQYGPPDDDGDIPF
jgi:hypothetical protein